MHALTVQCSGNGLTAVDGYGLVSYRRTAPDQQPDKPAVGPTRGTDQTRAVPAHQADRCNHLPQRMQQRLKPTDAAPDTPVIVHNLSLKKSAPGLASSSGQGTLEVGGRLGVETMRGKFLKKGPNPP